MCGREGNKRKESKRGALWDLKEYGRVAVGDLHIPSIGAMEAMNASKVFR